MSACVYSREEELWEDLLYYALVKVRRERVANPNTLLRWHRSYQLACAQARLHLYNLATREWFIPRDLVEMARSEGLL